MQSTAGNILDAKRLTFVYSSAMIAVLSMRWAAAKCASRRIYSPVNLYFCALIYIFAVNSVFRLMWQSQSVASQSSNIASGSVEADSWWIFLRAILTLPRKYKKQTLLLGQNFLKTWYSGYILVFYWDDICIRYAYPVFQRWHFSASFWVNLASLLMTHSYFLST